MKAAAASYYPLFASLAGRRCLVVGGGTIAQRKVSGLLQFGAEVAVVSPDATKRLAALAAKGRIEFIRRAFRPSDLRGVWLVYAATDDQSVNQAVFREAQRRRIFANIVDQPSLCSFIAPAVVKRGRVVVAISTGGASPTLAKQLRRRLSHSVGAEYSRMLELLASLRARAKQRLPSYQARTRYFDSLVQGRVFGLVRKGRAAQARREALRLLEAA